MFARFASGILAAALIGLAVSAAHPRGRNALLGLVVNSSTASSDSSSAEEPAPSSASETPSSVPTTPSSTAASPSPASAMPSSTAPSSSSGCVETCTPGSATYYLTLGLFGTPPSCTYVPAGCGGSSSSTSPEPSSPSSSAVPAGGDVSITNVLDGASTSRAPGETVSYTVTVHNSGYVRATGVSVVDTPPAGLDLVSLPELCTGGASYLTCANLAVPARGSLPLVFTFRVRELTQACTLASTVPGNRAFVSAPSQFDDVSANNSAVAAGFEVPCPGWELSQSTVPAGPYKTGQSVRFVLTAKRIGARYVAPTTSGGARDFLVAVSRHLALSAVPQGCSSVAVENGQELTCVLPTTQVDGVVTINVSGTVRASACVPSANPVVNGAMIMRSQGVGAGAVTVVTASAEGAVACAGSSPSSVKSSSSSSSSVSSSPTTSSSSSAQATATATKACCNNGLCFLAAPFDCVADGGIARIENACTPDLCEAASPSSTPAEPVPSSSSDGTASSTVSDAKQCGPCPVVDSRVECEAAPTRCVWEPSPFGFISQIFGGDGGSCERAPSCARPASSRSSSSSSAQGAKIIFAIPYVPPTCSAGQFLSVADACIALPVVASTNDARDRAAKCSSACSEVGGTESCAAGCECLSALGNVANAPIKSLYAVACTEACLSSRIDPLCVGSKDRALCCRSVCTAKNCQR